MKNASTVCWSQLRPSGSMATKAASHLLDGALTNHLHWPNHQHRDRRLDGGLDIHQTATSGTPLPHWHGPFWKTRHLLSQGNTSSQSSCISLRLWQRKNVSLADWPPFALHMMEWLLSSKNSTGTCVPHSWGQIHLPYWPSLPVRPSTQVSFPILHQ